MKRTTGTIATCMVFAYSSCFADCRCDDWVAKDGYCVDYVNQRVPEFRIPHSVPEIINQKNKDPLAIDAGDVAMFNVSNYWHVAYVEKVHVNRLGVATAIDVSEMNFGGQLSLDEFQGKWGIRNESEWQRAVCCGVTDNYGIVSSRRNIPVQSIKQVWSPDIPAPKEHKLGSIVVNKVKEVVNRLLQLSEKYL